MTLYTLGPNENKDGPFAEVHARNEFEARKKVQSVDNRRNGSISTPFTAYQLGRQIRCWRRPGFLRSLRTCRQRSADEPNHCAARHLDRRKRIFELH
jgi:hypothetical protein